MIEARTISVATFVAVVLWIITVVAFIASIFWPVDALGRGAVLLGLVATCATVRTYAVGVARVVRDRDELSADIRKLSMSR